MKKLKSKIRIKNRMVYPQKPKTNNISKTKPDLTCHTYFT